MVGPLPPLHLHVWHDNNARAKIVGQRDKIGVKFSVLFYKLFSAMPIKTKKRLHIIERQRGAAFTGPSRTKSPFTKLPGGQNPSSYPYFFFLNIFYWGNTKEKVFTLNDKVFRENLLQNKLCVITFNIMFEQRTYAHNGRDIEKCLCLFAVLYQVSSHLTKRVMCWAVPINFLYIGIRNMRRREDLIHWKCSRNMAHSCNIPPAHCHEPDP